MDNVLNDVQRNAESHMYNIDHSPFSTAAFSTLQEKISHYIRDLITESINISRRHQADSVSATHVEMASDYLIANTSRKVYRHLGTIGGILLGAALSNILAMALSATYTGVGTIISIVLGIVGAFLVALHIAKD
jgi:hypothetical protein